MNWGARAAAGHELPCPPVKILAILMVPLPLALQIARVLAEAER